MAKRKKARRSKKSGRLTKAEIKKAGGIKQAWRARKAGGGKKKARSKGRRKARKSRKAAVAVAYTPKRRRGKRKARKSGSGKRKSPKRVAAGKKAARTRKRHKDHTAKPGKRRRGKRKSRKSGSKRRTRRSSRRRSASKRGPVKVTIVRRGRRVATVAAEPRRRRRRHHRARRKARKMHHRAHRRTAAMENPMTGVELFVGSVTGLLGFLTADVLDRFLATHALVASTTTTAGAAQTYTDTPPTSGDYAGLYNATAICAPMDATRWLAGLGVAGVPLVIAHFVSAPTGRAALQFFGFSAGLRIVGKGLIDMVAQLVQSNPIGQQLYDGEMRAAVLQQNQGNANATALASLPTAGLGRAPTPRQLGAGKPACAPCAAKQGAGYPSAPRQATMGASTTPAATTPTTPTTQNQPPAATTTPVAASPTPPLAPTASNTSSGLTGRPRGVGTSKRVFKGRFNWGSDE
jgi:hypothetical protein